MEDKTSVDKICVEVFSRVSASISHELKNALAIINENAGLLDDLLLMAGDEEKIGKEHIQAATSTITKQVSRSNTIIKNLNVFAHSGDTILGQANLYEVLTLVAALTDRQVVMKDILIELSCGAGIEISTYLLVFESLLYLTVVSLIDEMPAGGKLTISASRQKQNIIILFYGGGLSREFLSNGPAQEMESIVNFLEGSIFCGANELSLSVPAEISA
ncbi:MAG: hypothetical protein GY702_12025 [Desulfobulbaceae bacterium]|nr:hypothetical protein [Desulfobulbaceae bacterium]